MSILDNMGIPDPENQSGDKMWFKFPAVYSQLLDELKSIIEEFKKAADLPVSLNLILTLSQVFLKFRIGIDEILSTLIYVSIAGIYTAKNSVTVNVFRPHENKLLKLLQEYFPQFLNYNEAQEAPLENVYSTKDLSTAQCVELAIALFKLLRNYYNSDSFDLLEKFLLSFSESYLTEGWLDMTKLFGFSPREVDPLRIAFLAEMWIAVNFSNADITDYSYPSLQNSYDYNFYSPDFQYLSGFIDHLVETPNLPQHVIANGRRILELIGAVISISPNRATGTSYSLN